MSLQLRLPLPLPGAWIQLARREILSFKLEMPALRFCKCFSRSRSRWLDARPALCWFGDPSVLVESADRLSCVLMRCCNRARGAQANALQTETRHIEMIIQLC